MTEDRRLLTTDQAAARLGLSRSTLMKLRLTPGAGPRFIKLARAVRYSAEALDAYAKAREHSSTSEYAA